jgi:hypothetical protein
MNSNIKIKSYIPKIFLVPKKSKRWITLIGTCLIYFAFGASGAAGILSTYLISYFRFRNKQELVYSDAGWEAASDSVCSSMTIFFAGMIFSRFKFDPRLINLVGCTIFR